ncbi:MAG: hypothetical protein ABIP29_07400 [Candidatus Eisenbacteria bacterium]
MSSFTGSEISAVDAKGRMNVPARLRRGLSPDAADTFTIVLGADGCVNMYPLDSWRVFEAAMRALPIGEETARDMKRLVNNTAHETTLDGQGRVTLTAILLELGGIKGQAKLVAAGEYIELWNPERFAARMSKLAGSYENILHSLMGKEAKP